MTRSAPSPGHAAAPANEARAWRNFALGLLLFMTAAGIYCWLGAGSESPRTAPPPAESATTPSTAMAEPTTAPRGSR